MEATGVVQGMRIAVAVLALAGLGCSTACGTEDVSGPQAAPRSSPNVEMLRETWRAYVSAFVQADGRVIDPRSHGGSTSEGQAYTMLRAAWMDDRAVFESTYNWARNNLNAGVRTDTLWAWRWGQAAGGRWGVLDPAFAADGDQDAALALIMAWRRWGHAGYLEEARRTLADLWQLGTAVSGGRRYLLGGDSLCQARGCRLNPSYYAPYAYRIFARHDPARPWSELVDSSYALLEANSGLTTTALPSDWLLLDAPTGTLRLGDEADSQYSYDAFRVHWRVAVDAALYGDPRADAYLRRSSAWLVEEWKRSGRIPASVSRSGAARVDYEALEMEAAVAPAVRRVSPDVGNAMHGRVQSTLSGGLWGERDSYYLQNWAWFGAALYEGHLSPLEDVR